MVETEDRCDVDRSIYDIRMKYIDMVGVCSCVYAVDVRYLVLR